jgi:hypothetical protein
MFEFCSFATVCSRFQVLSAVLICKLKFHISIKLILIINSSNKKKKCKDTFFKGKP